MMLQYQVIVWNGLNKPAERPVTKRETVTLGVQMSEVID
jgi:hypothetical protein